MEDIKEFRIGIASYILENNRGSKIRLRLDYAKDTYSSRILIKGTNVNKLLKQAGIIAKDMLSRKAQKNLSYKLLKLKI